MTKKVFINSYPESLKAVLEAARVLKKETVSFNQAHGRVLAEEIRLPEDQPPAPKSSMDGYALRAEETLHASPENPIAFSFENVVAAGHLPPPQPSPGMALRIMTGALLPDNLATGLGTGLDTDLVKNAEQDAKKDAKKKAASNLNAVVPFENTILREGERPGFFLQSPLRVGENVILQSAHGQKGDLLLEAGRNINPAGLGLLAGIGHMEVEVFQQPIVALLALGDELIMPSEAPARGQIRVSNLFALEALVEKYGGIPLNLGLAPDNPESILSLLRNRFPVGHTSPPDILLTLGGSRGGDFDFVEEVLAGLETELIFRKTRLVPGASTLFAKGSGLGPSGTQQAQKSGLANTLFFGLPGTPVASWCAFEALVAPCLWKLGGRTRIRHRHMNALLTSALKAPNDRDRLLPGWLTWGPSPQITPLKNRPGPLVQGERLPPSLLANALIHLPPGEESISSGSLVEAWVLEASP